jgi:hypothetical protein
VDQCNDASIGSNNEGERSGTSPASIEALYLNHRLPPWPTEDATRDRSNQVLGAMLTTILENPPLQNYCDNGGHNEYQQKDWELLVQSVPGLCNADPQVGA